MGLIDCHADFFLGGDFPVSPPDVGLAYTLGQLEKVRLSEADRAKILHDNAARLLNL